MEEEMLFRRTLFTSLISLAQIYKIAQQNHSVMSASALPHFWTPLPTNVLRLPQIAPATSTEIILLGNVQPPAPMK